MLVVVSAHTSLSLLALQIFTLLAALVEIIWGKGWHYLRSRPRVEQLLGMLESMGGLCGEEAKDIIPYARNVRNGIAGSFRLSMRRDGVDVCSVLGTQQTYHVGG